jgi:hypothetical protein
VWVYQLVLMYSCVGDYEAVWSTTTTGHATDWAVTLRKTAVWFLTQVVAATISQFIFSPKLWHPKSPSAPQFRVVNCSRRTNSHYVVHSLRVWHDPTCYGSTSTEYTLRPWPTRPMHLSKHYSQAQTSKDGPGHSGPKDWLCTGV